MKVAFCIESLPPQIDGVSRTYTHLANTLIKLTQDKNDFNFIYLSPFSPSSKDHIWAHHVISVSWIPLPKSYRLGIIKKRKLYNILDDFKPDIIHCSSPSYLAVLALSYAKDKNIKTVTSFHTDFVSYFKYYKIKSLEKLAWKYISYLYKRFDLILAPSSSTINLLKQKNIKHVRLWTRGVDSKLFNPKFKDSNFKSTYNIQKDRLLLYVGRLEKEKDLLDIVKADIHLKAEKLSYKILFVGDGTYRKELQKRLPDALFFGYKEKKDLSCIYASCDMLLFPSTTDTFGNVIQEASASGIPTVGVFAGGSLDLIEEGVNGILALPNNPKDFATKIKKLLLDKELKTKLKENTKVYAQKRSWETVSLKLVQLYNELLVKS